MSRWSYCGLREYLSPRFGCVYSIFHVILSNSMSYFEGDDFWLLVLWKHIAIPNLLIIPDMLISVEIWLKAFVSKVLRVFYKPWSFNSVCLAHSLFHDSSLWTKTVLRICGIFFSFQTSTYKLKHAINHRHNLRLWRISNISVLIDIIFVIWILSLCCCCFLIHWYIQFDEFI